MNITSRDRLWAIGGVLAAAVIVALGYFLFVSSQNSQTSDLKSQLTSAQAQTALIHQRITQLQKENANLATYKATLAADQAALPSDPALSAFLLDVQSISSSTGVSVNSLTFGTPTAVTSTSSTGTASTTGTTAATAGGVSGPVYTVDITLVAGGTATSTNTFLQQLQQVQPRAVLITSTTEATGSTGSLSLTLDLEAFIAPSTATAGK
jgi:hypothetical protein